MVFFFLFIVVLICIFLMISDVKHLFTYLLDIVCLLWKNIDLGPLPIFKLGYLFIFLLLSCVSSLHTLDIILLVYICFANIFPHSVGGLFILLIVSFAVQKLFSLHSPSCLFFLLWFVLLVSNPKNHCQNQCQGGFLLCFLLGVLWFQVLHLSL